MATSILENKKIKLMLDNGILDGKQRYRTVTYSNINNEANAEQILLFSGAYNDMSSVEVLKTYDIEENLVEEA